MSAQKSGNNIVLTAGTEASPTSIETMVTAINDVAFIEQADHIITLKGGHHIDFANFFLQVPSHITLIMHGRFLSMNSTTCGLILEGGCRVQIETAWGGDAGGIRRGALIAKEYNGQYPTIILNAGRTDFPTVSYSNYTPADVVFKIDGLNIYSAVEAHHKWWSSSADNVINNLSIMTAESYTGNYTALQLKDGIEMVGVKTNVLSLAGYGNGALRNTLRNTVFYVNNATPQPIKAFTNNDMKIDLYDSRFVGGDWNGTFVSYGWGASSVRFYNSYGLSFVSGVTAVDGIKAAFIHTATTGTADATQAVVATGGSASNAVLWREWSAFTAGPNKEQTVRVVARGLGHEVQYELQANGAPVTTDATYQVVEDSRFDATEGVANGNVTIDRAGKTITLAAAMTASALYSHLRWWLYQDAQMDLASFVSVNGAVLDLTDWSVAGDVNRSEGMDTVKTTGTVSGNGDINIIDAVGDSFLKPLGGAWQVYASATAMNADTQTATGAEGTVHRFNFAAVPTMPATDPKAGEQGFYVRITDTEGTVRGGFFSVREAGETIVSFGMESTIGVIRTAVETINTGLQDRPTTRHMDERLGRVVHALAQPRTSVTP